MKKVGCFMNILVIDSQGGGIGREVVKAIKQSLPDVMVTAVGTNGVATSAMLRAGANQAATGENAIVVCSKTADYIIGPVGIVIADAMLGEITPQMALAIGQSEAKRILIPVNHCNNIIVGVPDLTIGKLVASVVAELSEDVLRATER